MSEQYFPLGIAEGIAFLGRSNEADKLTGNLRNGRHSLLLSPRRYGKTSLARHVIHDADVPYSEIDLFLAVDEVSIETCFLQAVESLIQKVSETPEQWFQTLLNFFKKAEKKWTIGIKGLQLELKPESRLNVADNILSALNAVEHVLAQKEKRAVIFVDEFQEINKVKDSKALEGAIRHFAQASKQLVFIFSGSSRHLLVDIFGNRSRPLYTLCDWISLSRLDSTLYKTYINKIALQTWQQELAAETLDAIVTITECHAEATYGLCANLWQHSQNLKQAPDALMVQTVWDMYVNDHLKQTRLALSGLSSGQIKMLILIASGVNKGLTGKEAQKKMNLTSPSIVAALNVLEAEDFIEKVEAGDYWRIIDPIIKSTLIVSYAGYLT